MIQGKWIKPRAGSLRVGVWRFALLGALCSASVVFAQGPLPSQPIQQTQWLKRSFTPSIAGEKLPPIQGSSSTPTASSRKAFPKPTETAPKPKSPLRGPKPSRGIITAQINQGPSESIPATPKRTLPGTPMQPPAYAPPVSVQPTVHAPAPRRSVPKASVQAAPKRPLPGTPMQPPAYTPPVSDRPTVQTAAPSMPVHEASVPPLPTSVPHEPIVTENAPIVGGCVGCGFENGLDHDGCPLVTRGYSAFDHMPWGAIAGSRRPKRKPRHRSLAPVPAPRGHHVLAITRRQVTLAAGEKFVFYREEWEGDSDRLTACGQAHLERVASVLDRCTFPVIIETHDPCVCGKSKTDEVRRLRILEALYSKGISDAEHRVVVGKPYAEGLRYDAIQRAGAQSISGGGSGGFGGFGAGNFSGAGFSIFGQ